GLEQLAAEVAEAKARAARLEEVAASARRDSEGVARALSEAERRLGTRETLAALRATLEELSRVDRRTGAAEAALSEARALVQTRETALQDVRRAADEAGVALERAEKTVNEAAAEHERVHTADRVA